MKLAKLRVSPAYKIVSDELAREMLAGRLKAGEALPTETELANVLGVSRSTVRESIRSLEAEGLLRREEGKRIYVARPNLADLAPRVTRALILQQVTFAELWKVARAIEPLAAALAASNAGADQVAAMERNWTATREAVERGESFTALDVEFQSLVAEASGNRVLLPAREPVALLLYPALEPLVPHLPESGRRALEAHRQVLDAIVGRDAARAELWMARHLDDFRRAYELTGASMDKPVGLDPFAKPNGH